MRKDGLWTLAHTQIEWIRILQLKARLFRIVVLSVRFRVSDRLAAARAANG